MLFCFLGPCGRVLNRARPLRHVPLADSAFSAPFFPPPQKTQTTPQSYPASGVSSGVGVFSQIWLGGKDRPRSLGAPQFNLYVFGESVGFPPPRLFSPATGDRDLLAPGQFYPNSLFCKAGRYLAFFLAPWPVGPLQFNGWTILPFSDEAPSHEARKNSGGTEGRAAPLPPLAPAGIRNWKRLF